MKSKNKKMFFSGFFSKDGEFIPCINNKQVDFCLVLKKENPELDNALSNYQILPTPIFVVGNFKGNLAKEITPPGKTSICERFTFCTVANGYVLDKRNNPIDANGYIVVRYADIYRTSIIETIKANGNYSTPLELSCRYNEYMCKKMHETFIEQYKDEKTRVRS